MGKNRAGSATGLAQIALTERTWTLLKMHTTDQHTKLTCLEKWDFAVQ